MEYGRFQLSLFLGGFSSIFWFFFFLCVLCGHRRIEAKTWRAHTILTVISRVITRSFVYQITESSPDGQNIARQRKYKNTAIVIVPGLLCPSFAVEEKSNYRSSHYYSGLYNISFKLSEVS